jgi:hypothetical protein
MIFPIPMTCPRAGPSRDACWPARLIATVGKRCVLTDGAIVWVAVTVSRAHEPDGSPNYFISVTEDISSHKDAEDRSAAPAPARLRRCSPSASANTSQASLPV